MPTLWLPLLLTALLFVAALAQTPPKEGVTQADRAAWFELLAWPAELEGFYQETHLAEDEEDGHLTFHPVAEDTYLVEVVIAPGAYQPSYVFLLYDEAAGAARVLELPWYSLDANDEPVAGAEIEVFGLSTFEAETGELEIFSRWRGVGGCGSLQRYRVGADAVTLFETRAQTCEAADAAGDEMILDPHRWPVVWPLVKGK